jgi:hypothetical protein
MSAQPDHRQYVRRVVLPSGKTIEVVYFDGQPTDVPRASETSIEPSGGQDLHVCGACHSELVYPVSWEEAGEIHWQVTLRCPNCESWGTGVFEQDAVEAFDEELDRGTEALVRDFKRLVAANMEEQVERFIEALRDDLVLPEDF